MECNVWFGEWLLANCALFEGNVSPSSALSLHVLSLVLPAPARPACASGRCRCRYQCLGTDFKMQWQDDESLNYYSFYRVTYVWHDVAVPLLPLIASSALSAHPKLGLVTRDISEPGKLSRISLVPSPSTAELSTWIYWQTCKQCLTMFE